MNKQNKMILRAVKAALRVVEAVEKAEESKLDNRFGTSRRPQNNIPNYHGCPPPIARQYFDNGGPISRGVPRMTNVPEPPTGKTWSQLSEKERFVRIIDALKQRLLRQDEEIKLLKAATPSTEKPIEDFAGDDRSHVYSLIEKHLGINRTDSVFGNGRALVHLKSPELGTETLVVLSPEGETLLKIVKDNSRKFEVK